MKMLFLFSGLILFCCDSVANTNSNVLGVKIHGELKQWHTVTLDLAGPHANENDIQTNPFTDYRFKVVFKHESGSPTYSVPGYFAADGHAAESGAVAGNVWRVHFTPGKTGTWLWKIAFASGRGIATSEGEGKALVPHHGKQGTFSVIATDKSGRDFRGKGRLQYVGEHHLRFAGTGRYFLKAGPDAPETLLAYTDFDNTISSKKDLPLKTWAPHVQDWRPGDPTWHNSKGKGLIGAINYLADKGLNALSFIPYNAGGDGDNVWPFVERDTKFHYDVSKLDQWNIVFSHAQKMGLYLHFKLQETENDDLRWRRERKPIAISEALDGGDTGPQTKLYLRELIARFGHHLALNWNLGEESTLSSEQQRAMAQYIYETDPYQHHRVIHTYPNEQDLVYEPLLGDRSQLTGASLQNLWNHTHERTVFWVKRSAAAGKPWVVANDEQGPANLGVPPDPGFEGFSGLATDTKSGISYDLHDIRRFTLWGNLMAGGAGVEYYFGYRLPQNDLKAENFRSREISWNYCRIALEFFQQNNIPFWQMQNVDELVGNLKHTNTVYALAQPGEIYLVYLPAGGDATLDLNKVSGKFNLAWFNPRSGELLPKRIEVTVGTNVPIKAPSSQDWLAVIRKEESVND